MDRAPPDECQLCANSLLVHGSGIAYKPNPVRCPCRHPWHERVFHFTWPATWIEGGCTLSFTGDSFAAEEPPLPVNEQEPGNVAASTDGYLTPALPERSSPDRASEFVCSSLELQGLPRSMLDCKDCLTVHSASAASKQIEIPHLVTYIITLVTYQLLEQLFMFERIVYLMCMRLLHGIF